ncbi:DUF6623 family protein [Streptomyces sp. NPDC056512]|uniref:DUF6623 family protein n=1 Tax=Streptomyces sp. NPDC056512 TaxID=3345846 RepID=UPI0036BB53EF
MTHTEIWLPGHTVKVECPWWHVQVKGNIGRIARPDESGWCHFSIPTPVLVANEEMYLNSASLMFSTGDQATITTVEIWHGDTSVLLKENLALQGDGRVEMFTLDDEYPAERGVGIAAYMTFGPKADDSWVDFISVGAEFI